MIPSNPLYNLQGSTLAFILAAIAVLACIAATWKRLSIVEDGKRIIVYLVPIVLAYIGGSFVTVEQSAASKQLYQVTPISGSGEPEYLQIGQKYLDQLVFVFLLALLVGALVGTHRALRDRRPLLSATLVLCTLSLTALFVTGLTMQFSVDSLVWGTATTLQGMNFDLLLIATFGYFGLLTYIGVRAVYRGIKMRAQDKLIRTPVKAEPAPSIGGQRGSQD